jgi:hypothetical protein
MAAEIVNVVNTPLDTEKQVQETVLHLEDALASLNIDPKDADEAFAFLRDHPNADGVTQEAISILADEGKRKQLLRKIDWAILPCMIATYFLQFLDKTTIGYTAVMGLRDDTHLKGQQYSDVAMIFVSRASWLLVGSIFGLSFHVADGMVSILATWPPSFQLSISPNGYRDLGNTWEQTSSSGVPFWQLMQQLRTMLA